MSRTTLILLATLGSAGLLGGAFVFQFLGYAPCQLCLYQRWPHGAAIVIGVLALLTGWRLLPWLGAVAAAATAAIGVFHVGVEQKWWEGLASCTADALAGVSADDLLNFDATVGAPVRCDAVAWQLMGISMAGWNVILSAILMVIWLMAARRR